MLKDLVFSTNATNLLLVAGLCAGLGLGCVPQNTFQSNSSKLKSTSNQDDQSFSWNFSEGSDEMGRGKIYVAHLQSSNLISLEFPYQGEQRATLTIREHPKHGKDVYVSLERGQLLDSDFNEKVNVRFDDDKPQAFSTASPADLSSDTLFLRNASTKFINRLPTAKTVRIEVPVYQAGNQIFVFNVQGFKWKK